MTKKRNTVDQITATRIRARTRVLTQCRGTLLTSTAIRALKLSPGLASRFTLAERPPSWTVGHAVMNLPRLARHLNDTGEWTSGLAALSDAEGEWLPLEAYRADYQRTRRRYDISGLAVRLGTQRVIVPDDAPSLAAWLAGDVEQAQHLLVAEEQAKAQGTRQGDHHDRIGFIGLDLVDAPPTPYQRWMVRERASRTRYADHDLRIMPRQKAWVLDLDQTRPAQDVLVVARRVVYQIAYDVEGRLLGAKKVENPWLGGLVADQVTDLLVWGDPAADWAHALTSEAAS